jgi:hypothetical protein
VPYPDTRGLVEALRKQIPPDLPYRITDMFATIMLYDNKAVSAKVQPTSDCKYKGGDRNRSGGGLTEIETRSALSYKGRLSWEGAGSSEGAGLPARWQRTASMR